jgi:hypothetical protein
MPPYTAGNRDDLKLELAAVAARLIAEDGCDYANAKRKAAELVLGGARAPRGGLPDNELIEAELRRHLRTFSGSAHTRLLTELRAIALGVMDALEHFNPHLTGAVLNATATEHSDLHLLLFVDSAKDVELHLLEAGIEFEVDESDGDDALETIRFLVPPRWRRGRDAPLGVVAQVMPVDAIRVAPRLRAPVPELTAIENAGRAGRDALRTLLEQHE